MARKSSGGAIDFARIMAMRANNTAAIPPQEPTESALATDPSAALSVDSDQDPAAPVGAGPACEPIRHNLEVAAESGADAEPASISALAPRVSAGAALSQEAGSARPAVEPGLDAADVVVLRIGMSRPLHERVRALAALEGKSPVTLAREVLSSRTPLFTQATPLSALAHQAKEAFPSRSHGARADVRMQVRLSHELNRRVHQLAALRAQTLAACMSDLFEASVPTI